MSRLSAAKPYVLVRVLHEIQQGAAQVAVDALDRGVIGRADLNRYVFLMRKRLYLIANVGDELAKVHIAERLTLRHRVRVEADEQKHVVDEAAHALLLAKQAVYRLHVLGALRLFHLRRAFHQLQAGPHYRQRRLELVARVYEEVAASLFKPQLFREVLQHDHAPARKHQRRRLDLHPAAAHYGNHPLFVRLVEHLEQLTRRDDDLDRRAARRKLAAAVSAADARRLAVDVADALVVVDEYDADGKRADYLRELLLALLGLVYRARERILHVVQRVCERLYLVVGRYREARLFAARYLCRRLA